MRKRAVLSILDNVFPKSRTILFNSFPDVSDNVYALYRYIVLKRPDILKKYRLIWTVSANTQMNRDNLKMVLPGYEHQVVKKKSLKGLFLFLNAKYLVTSHGYFGGIGNVKNQTHINLWHGMPFKTIGKGMKQKSSTGFEIEADYTIATSAIFRDIMAYSFDINSEKVLVTGLPRNDLLFIKGCGISKLPIQGTFKKVIMWMPTYRKSVVGDIRSDGDSEGFELKEILFHNFDKLNNLLKKNNYLMIIKPHPMDELSKMDLPCSENIIIVNDDLLHEINLSLYLLLADTDVLITDYSSVFIDYLLTGNPIAFACNDIEKYKNTRGFYFDDLRDKMPGEYLNSEALFFLYLDNIDYYVAKWKEKYLQIREEFHFYTDNNSSQRVCDLIWKER